MYIAAEYIKFPKFASSFSHGSGGPQTAQDYWASLGAGRGLGGSGAGCAFKAPWVLLPCSDVGLGSNPCGRSPVSDPWRGGGGSHRVDVQAMGGFGAFRVSGIGAGVQFWSSGCLLFVSTLRPPDGWMWQTMARSRSSAASCHSEEAKQLQMK